MTCEDFGGRAHDYLFDALEAPDRAAFEEHLRSCESCRARLEEARRGAEKLKEWRVPAAPAQAVENSVIAANLRERAKRPGLRRALKIAGLGLAAAAAIYVVALLGYAEHVRTLRPSPQDLLLLADPAWVPGTRASARVLLKNRSTGEPVADAEVRVRLASRNAPEAREQSWTARTDASGSAALDIPVPEWADGEYALEVRADSAFGKDALDHPLILHRPLKVLVSTDKPIYQPSQEIRIRVLSLFAATQKPAAGEEARVEVLNPNGIKVFKAALRLSPFGIGSCALPLADELDLGAYRIAATVRGVATEKVVTVKKYVLPKFKVEVRTERDFYLPGETVAGEVKAAYFFGKPVAGGRISVKGGADAPGLEASGETDADGRWKFRIPLPGSWVGIPLEQGKGRLGLEIEAVDTAGHAERTAKEITVASDPFDVFLFPEGGRVAEGIENRFYLYLAWPDGRPCDAEVRLRFGTGETRDVRTGAAGLSVFAARYDGRFFPVECAIRAGDAPPFAKTIAPAGGLESVPFLLLPERAVCSVGETVRFQAVLPGGGSGTLYLDLVRGGQTALTKTVEAKDGRGEVAVDFDASLKGLVAAHLYRVDPSGNVQRDRRLVFVRDDDALRIRAELDREAHRPGEEARIAFALTGRDGNPKPGALSLCAVDEAVFALAEMRPGLLETYFQVEEALADPKWQVKLAPVLPIEDAAGGNAPRASAAVAARAAPGAEPRRAESSFRLKEEAMSQAKRRGRDRVETMMGIGVLSLAALMYLGLPAFSLCLYLVRSKFAGTVLGSWLGVCALSCCLSMSIPSLLRSRGGSAPLGMRAEKTMAEAPSGRDESAQAEPATGGGAPRVRRDFPETLLWVPELVTDDRGRAELTVPLADSITTWRLSMQAVTADGLIGSSDRPIRVFQDFFVDLDLPAQLTRNDEIEIPAVVYNYLEREDEVRLVLEPGEGFEVLGPAEARLVLGAGEVRAAAFRVKAGKAGRWKLKLTGVGRGASDALEREAEVVPDGRAVVDSASDFLGRDPVELAFEVPPETVPGSQAVIVKFYPGPLTTAVEGLESLVRLPHG